MRLNRIKTDIAVAVLVAAEACYLFTQRFDAQEPGLSGTTSIVESRIEGHLARNIIGAPVKGILSQLPVKADANQESIVWFGNSHQHAVNQLQPGDQLSSVVLHRLLNGNTWPGQRAVYGISFPNINYEELFLLALVISNLPEDTRPNVIIQGVRFHDAREMGVRAELRPFLRRPEVERWVEQAQKDGTFAATSARLKDDIKSALQDGKKDEGFEARLTKVIGPMIPIFAQREMIYAQTITQLQVLRDRVFRIDTTTKRPVLPSRYQLAMEFLKAALAAGNAQGVKTFLYNVPLRQEVSNPYFQDQYSRFQSDLATIAKEFNGSFVNYDRLIPRDLWGDWYDTAFPDFSHFSGAGHKLLAQAVAKDILPLLQKQQ